MQNIEKSKNKKTAVVVGAGLSGSVAARILAENGYNVTVYEKRDAPGGNAYDYVDENGILVQKYGPHIFHTSDKSVFDFLSRFTDWFPYNHKVKGNINGKLVPIPFNLTSLHELFNKTRAEEIENVLLSEVGAEKKVPVLSLKDHKNPAVRELAKYVYDNVFYKYTLKQWGFKPEELGGFVTARVPVSVSYKDGYFSDEYQFQPTTGFTSMIINMLSHENITVKTETDALGHIMISDGKIYLDGEIYSSPVIYTGRLDELFNFELGKLDFRSLDFKSETYKTDSYQPAAVVNYNTSEDYTRISEFKKFTMEQNAAPKDITVIIKEYPKPCEDNDVPYYPVPVKAAEDKYLLYKENADKIPNLYLTGRLALYKYVNMDKAVAMAAELVKDL